MPFASRVCSGSDVYWQDSCGNTSERVEECLTPRVCDTEAGACCRPAVGSGLMPSISFPLAIQLTHPNPASSYTMRFELIDDPGVNQQLWLMADLYIDDTRFVLGPKTDSAIPGALPTDRSLLLTRLGPSEPGEVRAPPGGIVEQDTGGAGPRAVGDWREGVYLISLTRGAPAPEFAGDWFEFTIAPESDASAKTDLGAVVARRASADVPATISVGSALFLQKYGGQTDYADMRRLFAKVRILFDDDLPQSISSSYGIDDMGAENLNTEIRYDGTDIVIGWGLTIPRCTDAGQLL